MRKSPERRALIKTTLLSACRSIILMSFGPQLGGFLLLLAAYVLGFRAPAKGAQ